MSRSVTQTNLERGGWVPSSHDLYFANVISAMLGHPHLPGEESVVASQPCIILPYNHLIMAAIALPMVINPDLE